VKNFNSFATPSFSTAPSAVSAYFIDARWILEEGDEFYSEKYEI